MPLGDLRYGARVLWRNRTTSVVAFLTLALTIGATTAMFTVADITLFRSPPFPEADRLMQLARQYPNGFSTSLAPPKFLHWKRESGEAFSHVAAYEALGSGFNLVGGGRPERLIGTRVSADFFGALGVAPALGRDFRPDEDLPGVGKTVVLSHHVWVSRFASRPDIVGQAIVLNNEPFTVIGVMPSALRFPDNTDLWTLFQFDPASLERGNYFEALGRLQPGMTIERAVAIMRTVGASFRRAHPEMQGQEETVGVRPISQRLYGDLRTPLLILLGAVGFVLLIACVNVANLQIALGADRQHEIALRVALGASRWSTVRQLLVESVLLAVAGGAAGIALAYWSVPALVAISPVAVAQAQSITVDVRILLASLAASVLVGMAFGLLPAVQGSRPDLDQVLRLGSRRTTGARGWTRRVLVAGELALALVLTVGAFLLVKNLSALQSRAPGFTTENLITLKLSLPEVKYASADQLGRFQELVEARLNALPGVRAASLTMALPLELGPDLPFTIEGQYVPGQNDKGVGQAQYRTADARYFDALDIPLRRGRLFTASDRKGSAPVAIINEAAARRYWPKENPLGRRITIGQPFVPNLADVAPREIVGVIADVRETGLDEPAPEIVYVPLTQQNDALTRLAIRLLPFSVAVRATGDPGPMTGAISDAIWSVDADQPISDVRLMSEIVTRSLGPQRFNSILLGSLAALALVLAAVGLYGVVSHLVLRQTREIGVRMALGATPGGVVTLFVRQAVGLAAVGILVGLAGAYGLTRVLQTLVTDMSTTDPWVFGTAALTLVAIAALAALRPALRAARVDPAQALRAD
jgi:predicted permease